MYKKSFIKHVTMLLVWIIIMFDFRNKLSTGCNIILCMCFDLNLNVKNINHENFLTTLIKTRYSLLYHTLDNIINRAISYTWYVPSTKHLWHRFQVRHVFLILLIRQKVKYFWEVTKLHYKWSRFPITNSYEQIQLVW